MARRWVYAAVAVPVVLCGAVVTAALLFDPNGQKDRIADAVRRATGRELTLAGPLRLRWSLAPTLEAEDVSLANMPGGSRPAMAVAARVEAQLRLWPLLSRQVELARVTLVRPDILIETTADGRGNWQFDRPAAPAPADSGTPAAQGARTRTVLDSLIVESGRVTWHDGGSGRTIVAEVPHATLEGGDGPLHLVAQAQVAGSSVTLDAHAGPYRQLTGAAAGPWPLSLQAQLADATLSFDGAADPATHLVAGRIRADVPDLARLGHLLQAPNWPALHDIHLAATLPKAGGLPQDVSLRVGAGDLARWLPGATLGTLVLNWPAGQPARLDAEGALAGAPWHATAGLVPAGAGVALRGLSVASAVGDLSGDAAIAVSPRPALRGTLVSKRLDLDAIRGMAAAKPASAPAQAGPAAPAPLAGRVFSDAPLPWASLRRVDADLQLTAGTIRAGGADFHDGAAHVVLGDGVLRIDPGSVQAPQGRVDFSASADARQEPPPLAVAVRSAAFAIDPLAQAFGLPGGSAGSAELDVTLHAAGSTRHALAASLDGHAGIALVDAEIANSALTAVLGDVLQGTGARLDANGSSHLRCLAVRLDAKAGQVTLTAAKLDTTRLLLDASGTMNLADETVALRLHPLLRLGGTGVGAPVRVDGPLRRPTVALDALGGAGRVGVVIGGLSGSGESCAAALTAARDGRPGPMPVESAPAKGGGKPADLLRSLLR